MAGLWGWGVGARRPGAAREWGVSVLPGEAYFGAPYCVEVT